MKKEVRFIDEKRGIIRITTTDERVYAIPSINPTTRLPSYEFYPSVTYITGFYPKGKFFESWLKNMGNEAEVVKQLAAEKGSKIHQAIALLLSGAELSIEQNLINTTTGKEEEINSDEYKAVLTFVKWFKDVNPKVISYDETIYNAAVGYAGSLDLSCEIDGVPYIVDFKTSKEIFPSHELQVSAYKHTPGNEDKKLAILQIGYTRNKNGYKFTEINDQFDLFLATYQIFLNEVGSISPREIELPSRIKL
jgi:hypothetical protein